MKFATRNNGHADGELLIVSRDLARATSAADIVPSLRLAVEDWTHCAPLLQQRAKALEAGHAASFAFSQAEAISPLPRAFQWLDASAYRSHGERMVEAFGVSPAGLNAPHPLMYQGCSDRFYGAQEDFPLPAELDIDLEAEVAVVTSDVPMASSAADVQDKILLVMLADDVSLRALIGEMNLGFGMIRCKPSTAFSPVAVTLDELGGAWRDGALHLPMHAYINDVELGSPCASEMQYNFFDLMAHAASTRQLSAGTIIGSGTVSNRDDAAGVTCISQKRAKEKLSGAPPSFPFLRFGDRVRIEMKDAAGQSIFGSIDHRLVPLQRA